MDVIEFERVVVALKEADELLIAVFDGAKKKGTPHACVGLLSCSLDTAAGLLKALTSALNSAAHKP